MDKNKTGESWPRSRYESPRAAWWNHSCSYFLLTTCQLTSHQPPDGLQITVLCIEGSEPQRIRPFYRETGQLAKVGKQVYWRDLIKIKSTSQDKRHFVIITVIVKVFIHCTFFLRMLGQDSRLFSKGLLKIIKNRNYDDFSIYRCNFLLMSLCLHRQHRKLKCRISGEFPPSVKFSQSSTYLD
jgi:hypothetical protein